MNTTDPSPPSAGFYASIRQMGLTRTEDRWVGGVCAGVAHRYGLDPLLVRGLVVVTSLFIGLGTLAYGLAWALLPESKDGRIHLEQAGRGHVDIALAGAAALVVLALSQGVWWWGGPSGWTTLWLLVIGAVIVVVMLSRRDGAGTPPPSPPPPGPHPDAGQGYGAAPMANHGPDEPTPPSGPAATPSPTPASAPTENLAMTHSTPPVAAAAAAGPAPADAPVGSGPPPAGAPTAPPPQPPPARSSGTLILLALGLCLLAAAGVLLAPQAGVLSASPALLIGGACLAIIGAAVIIGGMRGQSQGGLGSLGLIVAIFVVPAGVAGAAIPNVSQMFGSNGMLIGEARFVPATPEAAAEGYTMGIGELRVDLTALDLAAADNITVPVGVGVGELRVVVPDDWDITANLSSGVGDVNGLLSDGWNLSNGNVRYLRGSDTTLTSGANAVINLEHPQPGAPSIHIDARAGVGTVTIEEN